jgi:hypothetical protein
MYASSVVRRGTVQNINLKAQSVRWRSSRKTLDRRATHASTTARPSLFFKQDANAFGWLETLLKMLPQMLLEIPLTEMLNNAR